MWAGRGGHKPRPQQRECFLEVDDRFMRWSACPNFAGTSSEQDPQADSNRRARFDVADLIAHKCAVSGIKREVGGGLQQHPGIGLAPRVVATIVADTVHRTKGQ